MMTLTVLPAFLGIFVAVAAAIIGVRFLLDRRASSQAAPDASIEWESALDHPLLKATSLSTITFWDRMLTRMDGVEIMRARIAEAGLTWSVGRVTAMMLLAGTVALALLSRVTVIPGYVKAAMACFVTVSPYLLILRRRSQRLLRFEQHFPDALDSLARALRAGHPLAGGMELLAHEAPQPISAEMRRTVDEQNLGMPWEQALDHLAKRVPLVEVSVFTAAVQLQNRTGGKLHEVLGRLSETMRESAMLKGEVRSIAAHGRMTGRILTILPIGIACVMTAVNPNYLTVLFGHPFGKHLIVAALVCLLAAHLVIRKMVDIRL